MLCFSTCHYITSVGRKHSMKLPKVKQLRSRALCFRVLLFRQHSCGAPKTFGLIFLCLSPKLNNSSLLQFVLDVRGDICTPVMRLLDSLLCYALLRGITFTTRIVSLLWTNTDFVCTYVQPLYPHPIFLVYLTWMGKYLHEVLLNHTTMLIVCPKVLPSQTRINSSGSLLILNVSSFMSRSK